MVVGPTGFPVQSFSIDGISYGGTRVVDVDGAVNPLAPLFRRPVSDSAPDIAASLDADSFVQVALEKARAAGAPLGAAVSPTPTPLGPDWRTISGRP